MAVFETTPGVRALRARKGRFQAILGTYSQNRKNVYLCHESPGIRGVIQKSFDPVTLRKRRRGFFTVPAQAPEPYILLN